jgi:ubiquinone/menaquinone biosynthesis C-methylase UbiE
MDQNQNHSNPNLSLYHRFLRAFMAKFFSLLYHEFAWSYDFVANCVSWGQWQLWINQILPYLQGPMVLELGHGPGHLARWLDPTIQYFGVDESASMGRLARKNNESNASKKVWIRARAEFLPFIPATFDTIFATFPSEYIMNYPTLASCARSLKAQGELIILLSIRFKPVSLSNRFLAFVFQIFGQSSSDSGLLDRIQAHFYSSGFSCGVNWEDFSTYQLLILRAARVNRGF